MDQGQGSNQLNGWKEIAAFFGKSTRTVQRWEAQLRLPVHRIRAQAGDVVFALQDELETWRTESTRARQGDDADTEPADPPSGGTPDNDSGHTTAAAVAAPPLTPSNPSPDSEQIPAPSPRPRLLAALVGAAVLVSLTAAALYYWTRPAKIISAEFRGNSVVALDGTGRVVWSHQFEKKLWGYATRPANGFGFVAGDPPRLADMDRDGLPEVLAITTYGEAGTAGYYQELVCFSAAGRVLWIYRPAMTYMFAGQPFSAPWQFLDILVAKGTAEPTVWVSVVATPWWPTAVVRLDARGEAQVRFVSSGAVYRLAETTGPTGWHLLAGGVNNDYRAASLAVLDEHAPPAVSPQREGSIHHCDNCPSGSPRMYFTFPRTDINESEGDKPYNQVWDIRHNAENIDILTMESRQHEAVCYYRLVPSLEIPWFVMSDSTAHKLLEADGRLTHTEANCPIRRVGAAVRVWTPKDGWRERVARWAPR